MKNSLFNSFFIIFMGTVLFLLPFMNNYIIHSKDYVNIYYEISAKNNNSTFVSEIFPIENNKIIIEEPNGQKQKISIDSFKNEYAINGIKYTKETYTLKILYLFSFFLYAIGLINIIVSAIRYFINKRKKTKDILI